MNGYMVLVWVLLIIAMVALFISEGPPTSAPAPLVELGAIRPAGKCGRKKNHRPGPAIFEEILPTSDHTGVFIEFTQCTRCSVPLIAVDTSTGGAPTTWEARP